MSLTMYFYLIQAPIDRIQDLLIPPVKDLYKALMDKLVVPHGGDAGQCEKAHDRPADLLLFSPVVPNQGPLVQAALGLRFHPGKHAQPYELASFSSIPILFTSSSFTIIFTIVFTFVYSSPSPSTSSSPSSSSPSSRPSDGLHYTLLRRLILVNTGATVSVFPHYSDSEADSRVASLFRVEKGSFSPSL